MQTVESLEYLCKLLRNNPVDEYAQLQKDIVNENIPWLDIIEIANMELLIPALYYSLYEKELIDDIPDEQLKEYLSEVFLMNTKRNEAIMLQLEEVSYICDTINTTPLLLKGAAALVENDYPHIGIRSMTDIDIMPLSTDFAKVASHFQSYGYQPFDYQLTPSIFDDDDRHDWKMTKEETAAMLELHIRIDAKYLIPYSDEICRQSQNISFDSTQVLTPTYRLFHAFIHSEISNDYFQKDYIAIRQIYDFVIIVNKYHSEVDWDLLLTLSNRYHLTNTFLAYLYMTERLFLFQSPFKTNSIRARHHYKMLKLNLNRPQSLKEFFYFYFFKSPTKLSYTNLKHIYKFKSRLAYPFYIIVHILQFIQKDKNVERG